MSAILLAAYLAPAWVPSEFNYRWSLPSDPLSDEGLGGGVTDIWANHGLFSVSVLRACAA